MQIGTGRPRTALEPDPGKVPEAQAAHEAISGQAQDSRDAQRLEELQAEVELYREIFGRVVDLTSEAANGNLEVRLLHCDSSDKLRTLGRSICAKPARRSSTPARESSSGAFCCAACAGRSPTSLN